MNYIYCRKSTEQQSEASLEIQAETCRRWVNEPVTVISETGSGADSHRPQLNHMISKLKEGDTVCIYDYSRLSRKMLDALLILNRISEKGATLVCNGRPVDVNDPQDMFTFNVHSAFADMQRSIQNKKAAEGIHRQYEEGNAVFNYELFGFDPIRKGKNVTILERPDEAKVVRFIFEQYNKGTSVNDITRSIIGTPFERAVKFSQMKVRRILLNPIYMGYYPDFRDSRCNGDLSRYTRTELESHLIKSNVYPVIVSEDLWWSVFDRYRSVTPKYAIAWERRFTESELAGVIRCPDCNKGLAHFTKLGGSYEVHTHALDCPSHSLTRYPDKWLESIMRLCFYIVFMSGDEVGSFFSEKQNKLYEDKSELKEAIDSINKSISDTQSKMDRIVHSIADGIISGGEAKRMMDSLREELKAHSDRRISVERDLRQVELDLDTFIELSAEEIIDRFPNNVRTFYRKYIKTAYQYGKHIEVTYMNGKCITIPKPRIHYGTIDPVEVNVKYIDDEYTFTFDLRGPVLVKSGTEVYDRYIQELLDKAWKETIDGTERRVGGKKA